ncbi:MAG: hypothetical protein WCL32_12440 [Planctomycetota bacterium]
MQRMMMKSTVSDDGMLHLTVPVGMEQAHKEVLVTVESCESKKMTQDEWRAAVLATAGSIQDSTFERPPQGEFEVRDELP